MTERLTRMTVPSQTDERDSLMVRVLRVKGSPIRVSGDHSQTFGEGNGEFL
jgi:hypothetical protein